MMKKSDGMKYAALALLIIYIVIMMVGFLITMPKNLDVVNDYDKVIHFTEFFILSILTLWTLHLFRIKHYYVYAILLCLVFVVITEYLQTLVPNRIFSYYDMLADVAGMIVGAGVYILVSRK